MWVINGDWDNPDVRCSDPKCPASGKEVSLEAWNALEPATPQPEPQSAVEWVKARMCKLPDDTDVLLSEEDALDLARGCDRAHKIAALALKDASELRAQLAAAQDDLAEARAELLAIKVPDFDRCEKCNTELSQCGPQGTDGEPTLDCLVCSLTERLAETRKQLAAAQAEAQDANGVPRGAVFWKEAYEIQTDELKIAQAEVREYKSVLRWYEGLVRDCRKITSEGSTARQALDLDGGKRAGVVLAKHAKEGER